MSAQQAGWHQDLAASRNLSDWEQQHFGFVLSWFESWRLRKQLEACRETAVEFWRTQVRVKERKQWQLEGWAQGIAWYLNWLRICESEGREVCSVPERIHRAVMKVGAMRGLARTTRLTYASWAARFGDWVGEAKGAMDVDKASEWLGWLVEKREMAFSTQKQALNALVFFFRDVCGMEEVLFNVRLNKGRKREKVVMSIREVLAVLDRLDGDYRWEPKVAGRSLVMIVERKNRGFVSIDLEESYNTADAALIRLFDPERPDKAISEFSSAGKLAGDLGEVLCPAAPIAEVTLGFGGGTRLGIDPVVPLEIPCWLLDIRKSIGDRLQFGKNFFPKSRFATVS